MLTEVRHLILKVTQMTVTLQISWRIAASGPFSDESLPQVSSNRMGRHSPLLAMIRKLRAGRSGTLGLSRRL